MPNTDRGLLLTLAFALLLTVASQIFYIAVVSDAGPETVLRPITWFTEIFAFTAVTLTGLALAVRQREQAILWSIIAFSGALNVLQVAIGLSMFAPAMEARDSVPALFDTVLAGAFFFYFMAKLLLGSAGLVLGIAAVRSVAGPGKALGGLAAIAGLAAVVLSFLGMVDAKSWTFAAGAAGTAITALLGLIILRLPDGAPENGDT